MATERLIFEVVAEGKGLKVVQKDADALASSVERTDNARKKAGKGQDNYNKREKAIYQSNLSSAKGFSKMNQTIGSGSSGLVGAYATLAANVFAATAAFNALAGAARFEQLAAGLDAVGAAAGRNLGFASQKLVEVSGFAISTEQAMRSMALGISSGFSTDQMEGLTKIAKGASLALGRDLGDAMDRLTRGAAKLEPEILDELGIMVRLDDATENYATTLGKSVNQLSQFERRQAFLNAILEQGDAKFGQLAETVEVNQYDKLAATLANLSKSFLNVINEGLKPMVEVLAGSQGLLMGVMIAFASTIAKQVVPSIANLGHKTVEASKADTAAAGERLKNLRITKEMPKEYVKAAKAMADGTINQKKFDQALRSTSGSLGGHKVALRNIEVGNYAGAKAYVKKRITMLQVNHARQQLIRNMQVYATAQARENAGTAIQLIGQGSAIKGFKMLGAAISEYTAKTLVAASAGGTLTKALAGIRIAAFATMGAVRALGSAFMALLGPIGLVISIGMIVWDLFKDKFIQADPVKEEVDKIVESITHINDVAKSFNDTVSREGGLNASAIVAGYRAVDGVLQDTMSHLRQIDEVAVGARDKIIDAAADEVEGLNQSLITFEAAYTKWDSVARKYVQVDKAGRSKEDIAKLIMEEGNKAAKAQEDYLKARSRGALRTLDKIDAELANNPTFQQFGQAQFAQLDGLKERMKEGGDLYGASIEKILAEVGNIKEPMLAVTGAFDNAADAQLNLQKELNKVGQKEVTIFDGILEAATTVEKEMDTFEKAMKEAGDSIPVERQNEMREALKKKLNIPSLPNENIKGYVDLLEEARDIVLKNAAEVKNLQKTHKQLQSVAKKSGSVEVLELELDALEQVRKKRLEGIDAQIKGLYLANASKEEQEAFIAAQEEGEAAVSKILNERTDTNDKLSKQIQERKNIIEEELTPAQKNLRLVEQRVEMTKKLLDAQTQLLSAQKTDLNNRIKLLEAEQKLEKAQNQSRALRRGLDATPGDSLRNFYKFVNERKAVAKEENRLAKLRIEMERSLLTARIAVMKEELKVVKEKLKADNQDTGGVEAAIESLDALPDMMSQVFDAQIKAADTAYDLSLKELQVEKEKLQLANTRILLGKGLEGDGAGAKAARNNIKFADSLVDTVDAAGARAQQNFLKKQQAEYEGPDYNYSAEDAAEMAAEDLQNRLDNNVFDIGKNLTGLDKISLAFAPMSEMFQQLSAMGGPNANLLGALGDNIQMLPAVFSELGENDGFKKLSNLFTGEGGTEGQTLAESISEGVQGAAAGIGAVASSLSAVYSLKAAKTADSIKAIDKEIAATKRLYGGTEKGEKKIMELEKKKEGLKRKHFEQQKKMMIAQAIMGTALGIVNALSTKPTVLGLVLAGIVAAMGVAQLAIISSMSYQGGGSAGSTSVPKPSSVSMGERSNKVNLARNNVAGELAYMRGERGMGSSASDFTPAFTGYRNRATGGAAYVVGEQGPELFVPEVPGQIVPNDEMGEAAPNITANFNIQTIDATTMEETLTTQRGNIINMIREAANNSGEQFLESVDTLGLQTEEGVV